MSGGVEMHLWAALGKPITALRLKGSAGWFELSTATLSAANDGLLADLFLGSAHADSGGITPDPEDPDCAGAAGGGNPFNLGPVPGQSDWLGLPSHLSTSILKRNGNLDLEFTASATDSSGGTLSYSGKTTLNIKDPLAWKDVDSMAKLGQYTANHIKREYGTAGLAAAGTAGAAVMLTTGKQLEVPVSGSITLKIQKNGTSGVYFNKGF